jgi:HSP20 family protein
MVVLNQLPAVFRNGSIDSQIDRLLDDAIQSVNEWSQTWEPTCNVYEDEQGYTVQIALPGIEASQINVQVENQILRVEGERKRETPQGRRWHVRGIEDGTFSCSFRLPDYTDHERSTASYKQGLLTVSFPKREEAKPRQILIECQ